MGIAAVMYVAADQLSADSEAIQETVEPCLSDVRFMFVYRSDIAVFTAVLLLPSCEICAIHIRKSVGD